MSLLEAGVGSKQSGAANVRKKEDGEEARPRAGCSFLKGRGGALIHSTMGLVEAYEQG